MLICVNSEAGCLRKHIHMLCFHMQTEGREQTPETCIHTYCRLTSHTLYLFLSCILSSRRKLYEDKTPSRPMSSSLLKQSPRHDARMVSSSPYFKLSTTPLDFPGILVLRFNKWGFQIYRSLQGSCDDTLKY